jgi:hypothetical protein
MRKPGLANRKETEITSHACLHSSNVMLFTMILNYKGGTYISQEMGHCLCDLPQLLKTCVDWKYIRPKVSASAVRAYLQAIEERLPEPVDGLKQVWRAVEKLGDEIAILHVVNTKMQYDVKERNLCGRRTD